MNPQLLTQLFDYFVKELKSKEKKYLTTLGLDRKFLSERGIAIGFNSGNFATDPALPFSRQDYSRLRLILPVSSQKDLIFGHKGLVFPLRNKQGRIVNLYALKRSTPDHVDIYLNRNGLFPAYPNPEISTLYLTDSVLTTCYLIQAYPERTGAMIGLEGYPTTPAFRSFVQSAPRLKKLILIEGDETEHLIGAEKELKIKFPKLQIEIQWKK